MTNSGSIPRGLIIFGIAIPLAALLGFMVATPDDMTSIAGVAAVVGILGIPIALKWHQPLLIFGWNAAVAFSFLPGDPQLWVLAALASLAITVINGILNKNIRHNGVCAVSWSLLALVAVVFVTAQFTGGVGLRAMGGESYGGKKYILIFLDVLAYFALSMQRIPLAKVQSSCALFSLSGMTHALANLVYYVPSLWFVYWVVPTDFAISKASEDLTLGNFETKFGRLGGIGVASLAIYSFMLIRYGIFGIMDFTKPWRILAVAVCFGLGMLGGFRSIIILFALFFFVQSYFEGFHRTRRFMVMIAIGLFSLLLVIPFAQRLPISVQRTLSILPIEVDAAVRINAQASTDFRLDMWELLLPEIPRHFFLGKGYVTSASDYYFAQESMRRGFAGEYEASRVAGDYHSGPLSILIPFGIWGVLAFVAFNIASIRVLYANHKFGDPTLKTINVFLLSNYVARLIMFYFGFGAIQIDLLTLGGLVGLSISLNGGMKKRPDLASPPSAIADGSTRG